MNLPSSKDRGSGPPRACAVLTAVLLVCGLVGSVAVTVALPAGAKTAATAQHKKARPGATTSPASSVSPTDTNTTTAAPTPAPSQSTTTTSPTTVAPTTTSSPPASSTALPSPQPDTPCAAEAAVTYQGSLYCPGQIVGVQMGVYGEPSRVVLQGVTVVEVSGPMVRIMGGPACIPDPDAQEPQYCGATLATMEVDFTGSQSTPAPSTSIDLYGVTNSGGRIDPDGFVTVASCDPDTCP